MTENIPHQTVYIIIQKYNTSSIFGDRSRSGRSKTISTGQQTRIKRLVNHQTGISWKKIAQRFNVY